MSLAARRAAVSVAAATVARPGGALAGIENVFGRRKPRPVQPRQRGGDILGRALGEQGPRQHQIFGGGLLGEQGILQHPFLIELANFIRGRRRPRDGLDSGQIQQQLRAPPSRRRHQQDADTLAAGPAGAAGAMLHDLSVIRKIGVNDEIEVRQIDAAGRHVGGDADASASVAQGLQRLGAFVLRQFARERDHGEPALQQCRLQMPDRLSGIAKHQRARRLRKSAIH